MLIVHIDDDSDDREILSQAIQHIDPQVSFMEASNGHDGYKLVVERCKDIDCIFLDINMPLMNGLECLQLLKKTPAVANIPVVVYTTTENIFEMSRFYRLGASYLQKTYDYESLVGQLKIILQKLNADKKHQPRFSQERQRT